MRPVGSSTGTAVPGARADAGDLARVEVVSLVPVEVLSDARGSCGWRVEGQRMRSSAVLMTAMRAPCEVVVVSGGPRSRVEEPH